MVKRFLLVDVFPMSGRFPTVQGGFFPIPGRHFKPKACTLWKANAFCGFP